MGSELDKKHTAEHFEENPTIGEGVMYAQPGWEKCALSRVSNYISKMNPKCRLWQRLLDNFYEDTDVWYYNAPIGGNKLGHIMGEILRQTKVSTIYTNHCLRATSIVALDEASFETHHIARTSGHRYM